MGKSQQHVSPTERDLVFTEDENGKLIGTDNEGSPYLLDTVRFRPELCVPYRCETYSVNSTGRNGRNHRMWFCRPTEDLCRGLPDNVWLTSAILEPLRFEWKPSNDGVIARHNRTGRPIFLMGGAVAVVGLEADYLLFEKNGVVTARLAKPTTQLGKVKDGALYPEGAKQGFFIYKEPRAPKNGSRLVFYRWETGKVVALLRNKKVFLKRGTSTVLEMKLPYELFEAQNGTLVATPTFRVSELTLNLNGCEVYTEPRVQYTTRKEGEKASA